MSRRPEGDAGGATAGLILIALGVLLLLDRQGILDARWMFRALIVFVGRNALPLVMLTGGAALLRGGLSRRRRVADFAERAGVRS